MARGLIVGCGCRGRALGAALAAEGWVVRGTSRTAEGAAAIAAAGIEAVTADPDRIATMVEHLDGVAVAFWLLGTANGEPEQVAALHGPRLERMLTEAVDTPLRGFVYEAAGTVPEAELAAGAERARALAGRLRIPLEVVTADPGDHHAWRREMVAAALRLAGE